MQPACSRQAFRLVWGWIARYGIPQAVYCDRKNAYVLDRELAVQEQLAGIKPNSHIQRACDQLDIEVIIARSAQGKGRVGRSHGVYQLVDETIAIDHLEFNSGFFIRSAMIRVSSASSSSSSRSNSFSNIVTGITIS